MNLVPVLTDRYSMVRDLGRGGEGDVLLAADGLGSRWVVKQYVPGWSANEVVLQRLMAVRHGHTHESWVADERFRSLLWLQDWGTDPGWKVFFEVQEFVAGGHLVALDAWPLSDLLAGLVDAVAVFHDVVGAHRDVKPANVLIRSSDGPVLVLADVGLARALDEAAQRYSRRDGSAAYQGPEAAQGLVSKAGDWWSVGMLIAQAALGYHPFELPDGSLPEDQEIQTWLAQRDVPHLDRIEDDRVRLLCQGLLTRDSERRWGIEQVRAWQGGQSPSTGWGSAGIGVSAQPTGRVRTVLFAGADYDSPAGLASAMAAQPNKAGDGLFQAKDPVLLEDLRVMLRSHGLSEAQSVLDSHRSGAWETTFLRLLVEMDEQLDPMLAGQSMTPAAIGQVAEAVIAAGRATDQQKQALLWATEYDLWRMWRRLPGMEDAAEAAEGLRIKSLASSKFPDLMGGPRLGASAGGDVGWSAGTEAGWAELVDRESVRRFWDHTVFVAIAWMVLLAINPGPTTSALEDVIDAARPGLAGQTWWVRLTASGDPLVVLAAVSVGLAQQAQKELKIVQNTRHEQKQRQENSRREQEQRQRVVDKNAPRRRVLAEERGELRGKINNGMHFSDGPVWRTVWLLFSLVFVVLFAAQATIAGFPLLVLLAAPPWLIVGVPPILKANRETRIREIDAELARLDAQERA